MNSDRSNLIRFGVFEVDLAAGELRRNGVRVKLQEQPFQVLATLLEKPGGIVTKEGLQERIWKEDTFVDFDRSLATAVNKIRQALGDSATRPRFIETVPRRGYRFLGEVSTGEADERRASGCLRATTPANGHNRNGDSRRSRLRERLPDGLFGVGAPASRRLAGRSRCG